MIEREFSWLMAVIDWFIPGGSQCLTFQKRFLWAVNLFEKYKATIGDYMIKGHTYRVPKTSPLLKIKNCGTAPNTLF